MLRRRTRDATTPPTPCELLAIAQARMLDLISGTAAAEVETPQLGRVVYAKADPVALQRQIDYLQQQCNAMNGTTRLVRRPLSFESVP